MTWVLTSLLILALAAAASLALSRTPRLALRASMLGVMSACALLIVAAVSVLLGSADGSARALAWPLPLGTARMAIDGLSSWFLLTIGFVTGCVAVYSWSYMNHTGNSGAIPAFGALLCGLVAALTLVVCAADAVLFLIGWEAVMLSAFFLVALEHRRPEVRRGAWMYLTANHIGTALFVLPLFAALAALAGSSAFAAFPAACESLGATWLALLFAFGLLGFGTKAGLMPMHVWLPAAHPVAPSPVSALLSGVVVKVGIYGLLRLLSWLPPLPAACSYTLLAVAGASGVLGVLYALAQHDLKRLLAYHTVENIGIIALGIGIGMLGQATGHPALAVLGFAGALLHVTNHALFKGLLFLSAGTVLHGSGTTDIERLGGLARRTPVNACLFLVGAVAICGLPPLNGFVSEWVIYGSLFGGAIAGIGGSGAAPAAGLVLLALMGGLALACFAKVFAVVFLGAPRDPQLHSHATPPSMKIGMGALALACVLIGVAPALWLPSALRAARPLVAGLPPADMESALRGVLAPVSTLSIVAAMFVLIILPLLVARRWLMTSAMPRPAAPPIPPATWGCGFARPTPRMQYSASSFAASLIAGFRALLWPERAFAAPAGTFPAAARLETHTPDVAEHDLFGPLFRAIARAFAMLRHVSWSGAPAAPGISAESERRGPLITLASATVAALRRGSIQMRLAFLAATLVVLFLMEALGSPAARRPVAGEAAANLPMGLVP